MKLHMAYKAIKNMVLSLVVIMPLELNMGSLPNNELRAKSELPSAKENIKEEVPPSAEPMVVLLNLEDNYCDIECFLNKEINTIKFLSKTFGINYEIIYNDLLNLNSEIQYNKFNIGLLKNENGELINFDSFEKGLTEYFFEFSKNNPNSVSTQYVPYTGDSEYVEDLIRYFTSIYNNVDYLTAISIGAAESGYYQVTYMLRCNNIYGGMSNRGLIKYKSIEYGTLAFIRLLSRNYYGKGLNTIESIGYVYCPTYDEYGNKIASPHWINLVYKAKQKYENTNTTIEVEKLLND